MPFNLGEKVKHKSNGTGMVIMEILNEKTNIILLNIAKDRGFKLNDYICSWINQNKKESDYFHEHELEKS